MDVTVVIPVFNQEKFICSCIESILNQTVRGVDILVIDDGSTDQTATLLREFKGIRILSQKNGGTSKAWNLALRNCSSKYVIGLDSDDEFFPDTLATMVEMANAFPQADMLYSDYTFIDHEGLLGYQVDNPEPLAPITRLLKLCQNLGKPENFLPFGHVRLYKRESLLSIGGFNESYFYAEDFELVLRMAEQKLSFRHVAKVLYKYRWHSSNKGVLSRKEQKAEVKRAVAEYHLRNRKENQNYA